MTDDIDDRIAATFQGLHETISLACYSKGKMDEADMTVAWEAVSGLVAAMTTGENITESAAASLLAKHMLRVAQMREEMKTLFPKRKPRS